MNTYKSFISKSNPKKYKIHLCVECGCTQSPEWRSGPTGKNTLCNACGLRHQKKEKKIKSSKNQLFKMKLSYLLN